MNIIKLFKNLESLDILSYGKTPMRSLALTAKRMSISLALLGVLALTSRLWGAVVKSHGPSPSRPVSVTASPSQLPSASDLLTDRIEKDLPIRSQGELQISNARGDLVIEGWAQDKIRLKADRQVRASSPEEANRLRAATDFRFQMIDRIIELAAEYGKGLKIEERLRERLDPRTRMDMTVLAPAHLPLRVWTVNGTVRVKGWKGPVEIRTVQGPIRVEEVRSKQLSVLCPECPVSLSEVRASVRCMGGNGEIRLADVRGDNIYVESESGRIELRGISGEQLYVSKSGSIQGSGLDGRIEFHTREGNVEFAEAKGFLSGRTQSGWIRAKMTTWDFLDKAFLESQSSSIQIELPSDFSGEVELRSRSGKASSGFTMDPLPQERSREGDAKAEKIGSCLAGQIGIKKSHERLLRIVSGQGDVTLLKGPSLND